MPNIYFIFNLDDLIYLKNLVDFYIESLHKQLSYNYTLFFNKSLTTNMRYYTKLNEGNTYIFNYFELTQSPVNLFNLIHIHKKIVWTQTLYMLQMFGYWLFMPMVPYSIFYQLILYSFVGGVVNLVLVNWEEGESWENYCKRQTNIILNYRFSNAILKYKTNPDILAIRAFLTKYLNIFIFEFESNLVLESSER